MLLNSIQDEVKEAMKNSWKTYREIADDMGVDKSRISKIASSKVINDSYVELYDKLGYDILIKPIKKEVRMMHPEICYVFLPMDKSVGIVKWGVSGYYPTNYGNNFTEEDVVEMNKRRDVSKVQADAMMLCSMNNSLDTEEKWAAQYVKILDISRENNEERA